MTGCCLIPKQIIEIETNGDIYLCGCSEYLPKVVGNILDIDSFEEVHQLELAKKVIHSTTISKTFEHCVKIPLSGNLLCGFDKTHDKTLMKGVDGTKPEEVKIVVGYDDSCNLECPSCRLYPLSNYTKTVGNVLFNSDKFSNTDLIYKAIQKHGKESVYNVAKRYKTIARNFNDIKELDKKVVQLINNYKKPAQIEFGASGDAFFSQSVKNCIDKLEYNSEHRYSFKTNGLMMKSIIPTLKIKDSIANINISIDAGTKETHERLRTGSSWNQLLSNINWLMQLPNRPTVMGAFVLQKDNFREIPKILKLFLGDIGIDNVYFIPLRKPSHWSDAEYTEKNILSKLHPCYQEFTEIINSIPRVYKDRTDIFKYLQYLQK